MFQREIYRHNTPVPRDLDGQDIGPAAQISDERVVYAVDAKSNPKVGPLNLGTMAAIKNKQKLIHYFGYDDFDNVFEQFDLSSDPEEMETSMRQSKQ